MSQMCVPFKCANTDAKKKEGKTMLTWTPFPKTASDVPVNTSSVALPYMQ